MVMGVLLKAGGTRKFFEGHQSPGRGGAEALLKLRETFARGNHGQKVTQTTAAFGAASAGNRGCTAAHLGPSRRQLMEPYHVRVRHSGCRRPGAAGVGLSAVGPRRSAERADRR